jgi:precorrin-2 dehydrogenase / sirohydrochlorin ferrochelatase
MVRLDGKRCLVVGGGKVGERKAEALLEAGAELTLVSPIVTERIASWEAAGRLRVVRRAYDSQDITGMFLVIAATDRAEVNEQVYRDIADRQGASLSMCMLYDIADQPERSSFIMPAVVRRGDLVLTVSTSGAGPIVAKRIRDQLAADYGPEYGEYVAFVREYRQKVRRTEANVEQRRHLLASLHPEEVLERIRTSSLEEWEAWKQAQLRD